MSNNLYFMTPIELNSFNRVCSAGNCRSADKTDWQRFDSLMEKIGYSPDILRTKDGFKVTNCDLNKIYGKENDNA